MAPASTWAPSRSSSLRSELDPTVPKDSGSLTRRLFRVAVRSPTLLLDRRVKAGLNRMAMRC